MTNDDYDNEHDNDNENGEPALCHLDPGQCLNLECEIAIHTLRVWERDWLCQSRMGMACKAAHCYPCKML